MDSSDNAESVSVLSSKRGLPVDLAGDGSDMELCSKLPRAEAIQPAIPVHKTNPIAGNVDKLEALLASFYPQYARVRYIPVQVNLDELSKDKRQLSADSNIRYRCKVFLFEMFLECRDLYLTLDEAKEAVASMAVDLLAEFNSVIQCRSTDNRFGILFQPLLEEMTKNLASHSIDPSEEERVSYGHKAVTSVERYKEVGSLGLQKGILSANLSAIYEKMNATGTVQSGGTPKPTPAPTPSEPHVPKKLMMPTAEEALVDPLTAIHSHCQKRAGACDAPDFQIFEGKTRSMFGCIGKYDGRSYIAEGIYKTKKDAKRAAAALICQDVFGISVPVAGSDTAVAAKDAVIASSFDVKGTSTAFGAGVHAAIEKIEPAAEKITAEPPPGKKYISMVNECCQVNKLSQPDYQCQTGDNISTYFIIHALNCFDKATIQRIGGQVSTEAELPKRFISAAFTRKNDAKEDCAARIYFFLREHGVFNENGSLKRSAAPYTGGRSNTSYHQNHQDSRYFDSRPPVKQYQPPRFPPVPSWPPQMPPLPHFNGVPPLPPFPFPMLPGQFPSMPGQFPSPIQFPSQMFPPIPPLMNPPAILDPSLRPNNTASQPRYSPRQSMVSRSSSKSPRDEEPKDPRTNRR